MPYQLSEEFRPFLDKLIEASQKREKDDYTGALAIYNELQEKLTTQRVEILASRSWCHFKLAFVESQDIPENYSQAIGLMQEAINLAPQNIQLYLDLAWFYTWGTVQYEEALNLYREALEIDPNSLEALLGAASLYETADDVIELEEAIEFLEKGCRLKPNDQNNWYNLSILYAQNDQIEEAEKALSRSLLCPKSIETQTAIGNWIDPGVF